MDWLVVELVADQVAQMAQDGRESDQGELPSMEQQVDVPAVISGEVVEVVQHMVRVYQDPGCGGRRYGQRCASGAPYAGPDPNQSDSVSQRAQPLTSDASCRIQARLSAARTKPYPL